MKPLSVKRILAFTITIVMLFTMVSCTKKTVGNTGTTEGDDTNKNGTLFDSSTQISMVIGSHSSWPYNENWLFWKYMREAVGGTINLQVIPLTELNTKVTLMMATPKDLPDLIHLINKSIVDKFAPTGALIAIDDYLDKMPNYTKFWNSIPEKERNDLLLQRKSADGKTYYPQIYGMDRATNVRAWLYRKDIFEKNGLKPPTTMDEVYETARKLKKLYPDSYPLCIRSGLKNLSVIGPEWKPYFSIDAYYDFSNKKWSYGATESTMLEIIKFLIKMRNEALIEPDYLTITSKSWEELISNNRGFMMPEYQTRMDFFNIPARSINPEFTLDVMMPPKSNTATGQNKVAKYNVDPSGFAICNTRDKARIDNAVKLVDWYYSDKAADLLSWGKEGETYNIVNGKREYILGKDEEPMIKYGAQTYGLYLRVIPEATESVVSKEQAATTDFVLEHTEECYNPVYWLSLNDEESKTRDDLGSTLENYRDEMLSKFLLGKEPLSNWDAFQENLKAMGVNQLIEIYDNAYKRVVNAE